MRIVQFFTPIFLILLAFSSPKSNATSSVCLLLKQQMDEFKHQKFHPRYRRASKEFERQCSPAALAEKKLAEQQKREAALANKKLELTEKEKRIAREEFLAMEAEAARAKEAEAKEAEAKEAEAKEAEAKEAEAKKLAETTVTKQKIPAPTPVDASQEYSQPQSSLLEAMLLPLLLALAALIFILLYVKFVRSRMDEIKQKAIDVKNELAASKKKDSRGKAKVKKGDLDGELYFRRQRIDLMLASGKNVMLESIILSQYGVFIVLPQKQRGAIIGSAKLPEWKEQVGEELNAFESPLQIVGQCCHKVGEILGAVNDVEPIVAFNDMAVFKSQFPIVVMHKKKVNEYVKGFKELKYSDEQVDEWLAKIDVYCESQREERRREEEQKLQDNLKQHLPQEEVIVTEERLSPADIAEKEMVESEQETSYPEPGSYESSVSDIEEDLTDIHRTEASDKKAVDHIANLDALLNKAKDLNEKLESREMQSNADSKESGDVHQQDNNQQASDIDKSELKAGSVKNELQEFESTASTPQQGYTQESASTPNDILNHSPIESTTEIEEETSQASDIGITQSIEEVNQNRSIKTEDNNDDLNPLTEQQAFLESIKTDEDKPENMVTHSEFKRRAAKKAVDDGMFDYLEHYDTEPSSNALEQDAEVDLESELSQSLDVGKGFLKGLEQTDAEEPMASGNLTEDDNSSVDSVLDNDLESDISNVSENASGWGALKAEMEDSADSQQDSIESAETEATKSSWRALQEQVESEQSLETQLNSTDESSKLEAQNQDKESEKSEHDAAPSPFANLELDPNWAPKPPPEKVFKTKPEDDPDNN